MPEPLSLPGYATVALSRRRLLVGLGAAGLGLLASACSSPKPSAQPPSSLPPRPTLGDLQQGASQVSVLSPGTPVRPGEQFFTFALLTPEQQLISDGAPELWLFLDASGPGAGPIPATWYPFTAYEATGDKSPRSDLPGTYVAAISVSSAGNWIVAATLPQGPGRLLGTTQLPVTEDHVVAAAGSKAISVDTPVATTVAKLRQICTRDPVCRLHAISLADAVTSGKPTVVAFSTPLLCESRLCGPVLDELILVSETYGSQANFIHVEEFLPGPDLKPPSATLENQSPAFKAWGFTEEPWAIVMDHDGVIRGRLGPGPSVAPEIESVLRPLL